jgi:hypothetical protein
MGVMATRRTGSNAILVGRMLEVCEEACRICARRGLPALRSRLPRGGVGNGPDAAIGPRARRISARRAQGAGSVRPPSPVGRPCRR